MAYRLYSQTRNTPTVNIKQHYNTSIEYNKTPPESLIKIRTDHTTSAVYKPK